MYKHIFHPSILRSYDIRGVFEETLNKEDAFMIGYFFGLTVRKTITSKWADSVTDTSLIMPTMK